MEFNRRQDPQVNLIITYTVHCTTNETCLGSTLFPKCHHGVWVTTYDDYRSCYTSDRISKLILTCQAYYEWKMEKSLAACCARVFAYHISRQGWHSNPVLPCFPDFFHRALESHYHEYYWRLGDSNPLWRQMMWVVDPAFFKKVHKSEPRRSFIKVDCYLWWL